MDRRLPPLAIVVLRRVRTLPGGKGRPATASMSKSSGQESGPGILPDQRAGARDHVYRATPGGMPHVAADAAQAALLLARAELDSELARSRAEVERYRALFDGLPDAAFLLDASGAITRANAACAALHGGSPRELVGQSLTRCVAPEDAERTAGHVAAALAGSRETWAGEVVHPHGTRGSVEITAIPIVSAGRGVVGVDGGGRATGSNSI